MMRRMCCCKSFTTQKHGAVLLEVSVAFHIPFYIFKTGFQISDEEVTKDIDYQACLRVAREKSQTAVGSLTEHATYTRFTWSLSKPSQYFFLYFMSFQRYTSRKRNGRFMKAKKGLASVEETVATDGFVQKWFNLLIFYHIASTGNGDGPRVGEEEPYNFGYRTSFQYWDVSVCCLVCLCWAG